MAGELTEFSFRTREKALHRFREEQFDLLVIGGGITGAATARDAATRGLKVAVVEKSDFATGTSSRSSKLIHGGLRYLQNFEFGLVFEALAERALLLKTVPHMVRPLPFFLPVYEGDATGRALLTLGLWLYDVLALFRTPGFHKGLSRKELLKCIPFLRAEGLNGGFRYYDASMWDDVLAIETLRSAQLSGAAVANYVEAIGPQWTGDRVTGFRVRDLEQPSGSGEINIRAHKTVVCAGPWTDQIGMALSPKWHRWLNPSKGVHLIFDLKKLPMPGAMVMVHPEDGRVSFVIPRPDFGAGVVIVGTTDGPTPAAPEKAIVEKSDVDYLMGLLARYFPNLNLKATDILSAYVGVRPLMGEGKEVAPNEGASGGGVSGPTASILQKVSREHHIDEGPGGTIIVAGGKYTTHRRMAEEIVDFTLKRWRHAAAKSIGPEYPGQLAPSSTKTPVNPRATHEAIKAAREKAERLHLQIPEELLSRYGAEALEVLEIQAKDTHGSVADPVGFPMLESQLRYAIRAGMVIHLEDFYLRRLPLYLARADHALPWAEKLARVWADERGLGEDAIAPELERLQRELDSRSAWVTSLTK